MIVGYDYDMIVASLWHDYVVPFLGAKRPLPGARLVAFSISPGAFNFFLGFAAFFVAVAFGLTASTGTPLGTGSVGFSFAFALGSPL